MSGHKIGTVRIDKRIGNRQLQSEQKQFIEAIFDAKTHKIDTWHTERHILMHISQLRRDPAVKLRE